jgi:ABC-type Fe3+-siderophore transport system permease subunit
MKERKRIIINGYMKRIAIGILVTLAIVASICLIKSNYRNTESFSNGLLFVSQIEMAAAFCSLFVKTNFTTCSTCCQKRVDGDFYVNPKSFKFVIYMGIIGGLMMALSFTIQYLTL